MFLRVNGHQLFILNQSDSRTITKAGRRERSFRGQMRDARRYVRRSWAMDAVILEEEDATALKGLLWGLGHQMPFQTGLQGSTGLNPVPGFGALVVNSSAWGPHGQGVLQVPATAGRFIQYDAQLRDDEWTVVWRKHLGLSGWVGGARRSDGVAYQQGIRNDIIGTGFDAMSIEVVNGVMSFTNTAVTRRNFTDFAILPYKMSTGMMASVSNTANGKFGPCPALICTGDIFGNETVVCVAEVTDVKFTGRSSVIPGVGWVGNAQVVSFNLMELDPGFVSGVLNKNITTPVPPGAPVWWFDAGDIDGALNNSLAPEEALATWVDKGSRLQNATQAAPLSRPTFTRIGEQGRIGSVPAVSFDGVADTMSTTVGAGLTGPMTIACVHRVNSTGGSGFLYSGANAGGRIAVSHTGTPDYRALRGSTVLHPTQTPLGGNWAASIMRYDGAGSVWRINGVDGSPGNPGANSPVGLTLGSDNPAGSFLNGFLVEVLAWNDNTIPVATIQTYLEARYGAFPQT